MKKINFSTNVLALIIGTSILNSCGTSNENKEVITETTTENIVISGDDIFTSQGCVACHQAEIKTVGPSLKDISAAYNDNRKGLTSFLKEEGEAIIDPAQAAVMKPQLATTKLLSSDKLAALVDFLLSH